MPVPFAAAAAAATTSASGATTAPTRVDSLGDPLPAGAVARMGSVRFATGSPAISASFSPDGNQLVTANETYGLHIWDAATGARLRSFRPEGNTADAATFAGPDLLVVAWSNRGVTVQDARSGAIRRVLVAGGAASSHVADLVGSIDGKRLVIRTLDRLTLWDLEAGKQLRDLGPAGGYRGHMDGGIRFSRDGKKLLTLNHDRTLALWDAERGAPLPGAPPIHSRDEQVSLSADGKLVAVCGSVVRLFDLEAGKELAWPRFASDRPGEAERMHIQMVACSPHGDVLALLAQDRVLFWDTRQEHAQKPLPLQARNVRGIEWSPEGNRLAILTAYDRIQVWELNEMRPVPAETPVPAASLMFRVAVSPNGREIASGDPAGQLARWDARNGKLMGKTRIAEGIDHLGYSGDGGLIDLITPSGAVMEFEAAPLAERALTRSFSKAGRYAISPDRRLVAQSTEETIKVWDRGKGTDVLALPSFGRYPPHLQFTPDGRKVAAGSDGMIRMFDLRSGAFLPAVPQAERFSGLRGFRFSPDGERIVGGSQFEVVLWELPSEEVRWRFKVHQALGLSFSPDGRLIATADDNNVLILEAATGRLIMELQGHDGQVYDVSFLPDGRRVASASSDTTGLVWDLTEALREKASDGAVRKGDVESLWSDLGHADPSVAHAAAAALLHHPDEVLGRADGVVVPAADAPSAATGPANDSPATTDHDALIAQLSDPDPARREAAHKMLERAGQAAVPAVSKALADGPEGEVGERLRSIARLIGATPTPPDRTAVADRPRQETAPAPSPRDARLVTLLQWLTTEPNAAVVKQAKSHLERLTASPSPEVATAARNALGKNSWTGQ